LLCSVVYGTPYAKAGEAKRSEKNQYKVEIVVNRSSTRSGKKR